MSYQHRDAAVAAAPPVPEELAARIEPFDSFWEGPEHDVEGGYARFHQFYKVNYLQHVPEGRDASILVISCGPGYFVEMLKRHGYTRVVGIDSFAEKLRPGQDRGLDLRHARAVPFLATQQAPFDVIVCEQELNHLTKDEMRSFLALARTRLAPGGTLIVHGLNGANPITGAEALAQNFDHFNTFTEYSLRQVLAEAGFTDIVVFPLNLYVFYGNPFNYVAWAAAGLLGLAFRACFVLYGKSNRLFTKKIAAACHAPF